MPVRTAFMNDVTADVSQRCFEDVKDEVRCKLVRRLSLGIASLTGLRVVDAPEVFDHALRRAEVGQLAALVEQQGLVKHLQQT